MPPLNKKVGDPVLLTLKVKHTGAARTIVVFMSLGHSGLTHEDPVEIDASRRFVATVSLPKADIATLSTFNDLDMGDWPAGLKKDDIFDVNVAVGIPPAEGVTFTDWFGSDSKLDDDWDDAVYKALQDVVPDTLEIDDAGSTAT